MTFYKTESLRLHSNNDISSQFQVNIKPKKPWPNIGSCKNKQYLPTCIIRVTSLSDHVRFTALSQVSDTLQQICEIRDIRIRLYIDWFLISYAINCNLIPTIFLGDLENTGYHRQSYLRYTDNLIRLEDGTLVASNWRHAAEFWRVPSAIVHPVPRSSHSWKGRR